MDKKKIMSLIEDRKKYAMDLENREKQTLSSEHKRAIGETLKAVRDEISDLEKQLDESDDESSRSAVSVESALKRMSTDITDGKVISSTGTVVPDVQESLVLRSDESFSSRVKDNSKLDLGKFVRGAVTGNWENATAEMTACSNARSVSGIVVPQVLSAQIIDKARNVSLFTSAGVPIYPMESDNLTIARVKTDPVFKFKAVGEDQDSENDLEMESIKLESKTAYGYCYVPIETLMSAKNLSGVITEVFSQAMADCIDKAMLYGQYNSTSSSYDDFAPAGIMNDTDIHTIVAENSGYKDFIKGIGAVRRSNGTPTVLGINADTEEYINLLTDDNGQPLGVPKSFDELKKVVSNQLAYDESTGSDALVFDPQALAIGLQNNISLEMIKGTDKGIKAGMVCFRIMAMLDCIAVKPKHIAKITGVNPPEVIVDGD
ncbi:MAG: phage major capsid protein [Clostridia bacterium]|nr:phage major capsid protein [Clostridia bacterium]